MLVTVFCCLLLLGLATPGVRAAFGDPMNHGRDDLFEMMGQAKVNKFEVEKGQVSLDISLEDTEGQDEVWILDFQDFHKSSKDSWPVVQDVSGGALVAENTGTCSSVFSTVPNNPNTGFYKDVFRPVPPGNKSLFNSFQTTDQFVQKGDIKLREDHVMFDGSIDTMFNCRDSNNLTIWHKEVTPETVEFNTTLYMTNMRPLGSSSNPEPAYVQSYAILYWRLLRVALSRFLISSTDRLKPIFEYATVRPVYLNDDEEYGFDRFRADVEIAFRTVTSHPNGSLVSVFKTNSLVYEPADLLINNKLSHIKETPGRGCDRYLGLENGDIQDDQITTSSIWMAVYDGANGRLNAQPIDGGDSAGGWVAGVVDLNQWIQVDLLTLKWVSAVLTQGIFHSAMWVSQYQISYSTGDSGPLNLVVDEDGNAVTFDANYDGQTIVSNQFDEPILAQRIRILPQTWDNNIALRFELLGCDLHGECYTVPDGADYRGTVSITETGETCQRWSSKEPNDHSLDSRTLEGLGDHNFCRNIDNSPRPWCYTIDPNVPMAFCAVGAPQDSCSYTVLTNQPEDSYVNYAPYCNFTELENQCTQRWVFVVVLDVDTSEANNRMPMDATGEFTFNFDTYDCPNNDRMSCRKLDIPEAIVSNEITLQTTVEVVDDVKDSPRIYLKKVHGSDPTIDIRDGVQPGVSHLEQITVETYFFPQFLRSNLELELTLFMVCLGSEYNLGDGCLTAPTDDTYTAYVSSYFYYRLYTNPLDLTQYTELEYDDMAPSAQTLDSHEYLHASEIHRTIFTNKALSARSMEYTITSVFRLVEKSTLRKRDIFRRDVRDKINDPIISHQSILFTGCPSNSTHNAQDLACVCNIKGEEYSTETFQCMKLRPNVLDEKNPPVDDSNSPGDDSDSNSDGEYKGSGSTAVQSTALLMHLFAGTMILVASLF